jgi:hypothetical protein
MPFDPYAFDLARSVGIARQPALSGAALLAVPLEVRDVLWHGLRAAVEQTLALWENTPPGVKREPPVFNIQHAGQPSFHPDDLRQQTLDGWHRLTGLELRLAVQIMEALIWTGDVRKYGLLLTEQCARIGQLYRELARRAGAHAARCILYGGLRLLRYRDSSVLAPLIYE